MRAILRTMVNMMITTTKTAIMDAADNAVRRKGYNGFNLDQIARDVGIKKSSIYHHFSSKAELIAAIFRRFSERIFSFLEQSASAENTAGDRLMTYISETRALIEEGKSICLSIALNVDLPSLDAAIAEDLALFHTANIDWLTDTFELGLRDGSIANIGDPAEEANACLALVDGAQLMARFNQDVILFDRSTRLLRSRITVSAPKEAVH